MLFWGYGQKICLKYANWDFPGRTLQQTAMTDMTAGSCHEYPSCQKGNS